MTVIVPAVTQLTRPYWEGAAVGELRLQWCLDCDQVWHPPQPACPRCRSRHIEWRAASGRGRIHSYTVVRHAAHPAFTDAVPYTVVLVALDEGPKIIANLRGPVAAAAVDLEVEVVFREVVAGTVLPEFQLREERDT